MLYNTKNILRGIALFSLSMFSCTNHQPAVHKDADSIHSTITQSPSLTKIYTTSADTLVVNRKAAVFFEPDSSQIEKRKRAVGEDDFYAGVEDYAYYLNGAHDYLDSTRLLLLDAKGKKYLFFIDNNQTTQTIKLDTLSELWGIYFFTPGKKAKQVDMTMIEEEYKSYFQ